MSGTMANLLWPLAMMAAALVTWSFSRVLQKFSKGEVREKYLPRFETRGRFSYMIFIFSMLWILSELI